MDESQRIYKLREAEVFFIPQIREAIINELGPSVFAESTGDTGEYYEDGYANEAEIFATLKKLLTTNDEFLVGHPVLAEMRIEFAEKCMKIMDTKSKSLLSARIMDIAEEMYHRGFMTIYDKMTELNDSLRRTIDTINPSEEFPSVVTVSKSIKRLSKF